MSGIVRQINGSIAQSKSKGAAFRKELAKVFSQEAIAKEMPKKQPLKKGR